MKTETKFTPGPWRIEDSASDDYEKGGICICTNNLNICTMADGDSGDEAQKADAHLIAAAPDLYHALRGILRHIPKDEWGKEACAALAKAEGKQ